MTAINKAYRRYADFYVKWSAAILLVMGAFLISVSIVLVITALSLASDHSQTERNSLIACQRAREFGPPLGAFFAREHVLNEKQEKDYLSTIPKHC